MTKWEGPLTFVHLSAWPAASASTTGFFPSSPAGGVSESTGKHLLG